MMNLHAKNTPLLLSVLVILLLLSIMGCEDSQSKEGKDKAGFLRPSDIPSLFEGKDLGEHLEKHYSGTLEAVLEKNILRVVTSKNSFDYFIHQGKHGGYQYEMVSAFVKSLNKKYRKEKNQPHIKFVLLPVPSELMISMVVEGKADIIAARATITEKRKSQVLFSKPYQTVSEQLIINDDVSIPDSWKALSGMEISVRKGTSYYESLNLFNQRLQAENIPLIKIKKVSEELETESILSLVASGHFSATVSDSIISQAAVKAYPELTRVDSFSVREKGELAWAVELKNDSLLNEINQFLPQYKKGTLLGNLAVNKYFRSSRIKRAGHNKKSLSPYDDLFKKYAKQYGFDWQLMAAVAYQESEFKQMAGNRSSATGLFQIKPQTAAEPYINIPDIQGEKNAENNIHAGVKYLAWIKARYFDDIEGMSEADRICMTLAAYNAGPRTLLRARARAEAGGVNPNIWFNQLELVLLEMHKVEPVKYVSDINQHYLSYILLGI